MPGWHIGIIGGSWRCPPGLLEEAQEIAVASAFGEPSGPVTMGRIGGVRLTVLARRGEGCRISPSDIDYRANIDVLKRCGVTDVVAISATAPCRDDLVAGDVVVVDQFIDRTVGRARSFFGTGLAAHVNMIEPVCARLSGLAADAAETSATRVHRGGCYVAIEGPQSATGAELGLYRQWGGDVIGMTAVPETYLAREAELPYALLAIVAGHDHLDEERTATMLRSLAAVLPETREASPIDRALDGAIVTSPNQWDARTAARLDAVAGRVLRVGRPEWF